MSYTRGTRSIIARKINLSTYFFAIFHFYFYRDSECCPGVCYGVISEISGAIQAGYAE